VFDHVLGRDLVLKADLLGLASAIESHKARGPGPDVQDPLDEDGWFLEAHVKLAPVDFATDGVFMAGWPTIPSPWKKRWPRPRPRWPAR
jgi:heterodisulfide reductase subunit A